jgi:hypothetical protein
MTMVDPSGDELPLVLIARTFDGGLVSYLSEAMSNELQRELEGKKKVGFPAADSIVCTLRSNGIQSETNISKTYIFPQRYANTEDSIARCLSNTDLRVKEFRFDKLAEQVYAIEEDDRLLSACVSVRQNSDSAEAWVFTSLEHRGRGFAQLVVSAWAKDMIRAGLVPFYSHKIENVASASVARKLGLIPVFEELTLCRKKE